MQPSLWTLHARCRLGCFILDAVAWANCRYLSPTSNILGDRRGLTKTCIPHMPSFQSRPPRWKETLRLVPFEAFHSSPVFQNWFVNTSSRILHPWALAALVRTKQTSAWHTSSTQTATANITSKLQLQKARVLPGHTPPAYASDVDIWSIKCDLTGNHINNSSIEGIFTLWFEGQTIDNCRIDSNSPRIGSNSSTTWRVEILVLTYWSAVLASELAEFCCDHNLTTPAHAAINTTARWSRWHHSDHHPLRSQRPK